MEHLHFRQLPAGIVSAHSVSLSLFSHFVSVLCTYWCLCDLCRMQLLLLLATLGIIKKIQLL
jgi:hypothetical protein